MRLFFIIILFLLGEGCTDREIIMPSEPIIVSKSYVYKGQLWYQAYQLTRPRAEQRCSFFLIRTKERMVPGDTFYLDIRRE